MQAGRRVGPTKRLLLRLLLNVCHPRGVAASKNQRQKNWFKMWRQQIEEGHSQTCWTAIAHKMLFYWSYNLCNAIRIGTFPDAQRKSKILLRLSAVVSRAVQSVWLGWLNKLAEDDAQRQNFCSEICDYRYFAMDNHHKRLLCTAHNPISITYPNYAEHQNYCFTFCIMLDTLQ